MAPYWYVSGFLLLLSLFEIALKKDERTNHVLTWLLCFAAVMLIIFGGIRGLGTGMDDFQYRSFFTDFVRRIEINGFFKTVAFFRYEPLIFAIAWVSSVFSHNASIFLFIFCAIAVFINTYFFRKMSPFPVLALALYSAHIFINKDINQIRFGLSSALFLGVLWSIYLRHYWWAFVFFILSFTSHNTGVMVVTLIPFLFIRDWRWWPVIIIVASVPLSVVGGSSFIGLIAGHLGSLGERASAYNNDASYSTSGSILAVSNLKNIMLVFVFFYFMLTDELKRENYALYRLNYLLILSFAIGGAIRIFLYNFPSGSRLSNYLQQVEPIILTSLVYQARRSWKPILFGMVVFFLLYYLYYNTISTKQAVTGYEVAREFWLIH
ncbi:EpsG family protein [Pantoea sp.]|uniref:EpsG family protein n=1 Tax=Pantoea sp. TaxID=69393 RepID=UPI0028AC02E6|nr:EpsG family protein [Pantoea sp.]